MIFIEIIEQEPQMQLYESTICYGSAGQGGAFKPCRSMIYDACCVDCARAAALEIFESNIELAGSIGVDVMIVTREKSYGPVASSD